MIIPPVGGLGAGLSGLGGLTQDATAAPQGAAAATPQGEALGVEAPEATQSSSATPNFGEALTEAISSLQSSQTSADGAAQALATGSTSDPEQAVSTVEDASMEMQLAAQIRGKATEALQTIFQTQV